MAKEVTLFEENRKKFFKKAIAVCGLVLILVIGIIGVKVALDRQSEADYLASFGQTAMQVGGNNVSFETYRYFYLNYKDELAPFYTHDGITDTAALDSEIRSRVAVAVQGLYGTISLAADYGISLDDGEVTSVAENYINSMKQYYKDNDGDYEGDLSEHYMTESLFEFLMKVDALEDKLFTILVGDDGEIANSDEAVLETLMGDSFVRAKHIFIEHDKGESLEENRKIAEKALKEYENGESFDSLVGKYSEDFVMPHTGYYFTRGEMIDEFESAAFSMSDGEVSSVIASEDGYHIILRLAKDEAYINEHFSDLKNQYQTAAFYEKLDARGSALPVIETQFVRALTLEEIK